MSLISRQKHASRDEFPRHIGESIGGSVPVSVHGPFELQFASFSLSFPLPAPTILALCYLFVLHIANIEYTSLMDCENKSMMKILQLHGRLSFGWAYSKFLYSPFDFKYFSFLRNAAYAILEKK